MPSLVPQGTSQAVHGTLRVELTHVGTGLNIILARGPLLQA